MPHALVIDDERAVAKLLNMVLSRSGFDVELAYNGREGIEKFNHTDFDVVITDLRMPGIGGKEILRHIQSSGRPRTPVVAISGTPWDAYPTAFNAVLSKPFSIHDMLDTVRQACQAKQSCPDEC